MPAPQHHLVSCPLQQNADISLASQLPGHFIFLPALMVLTISTITISVRSILLCCTTTADLSIPVKTIDILAFGEKKELHKRVSWRETWLEHVKRLMLRQRIAWSFSCFVEDYFLSLLLVRFPVRKIAREKKWLRERKRNWEKLGNFEVNQAHRIRKLTLSYQPNFFP